MDPVGRHGHSRSLITERLETVQVHHDLASVIVDVHVGRGDVGGDEVTARRDRQLVTERRSIAAGDPLERLGIDHESSTRKPESANCSEPGSWMVHGPSIASA